MSRAALKFRTRAKMGILSECLERLKEFRQIWSQDEEYNRRGDERPLWFRGHLDANWRLTPKLYRPEFTGADEGEIRHEFQSRALQLIAGPVTGEQMGMVLPNAALWRSYTSARLD